MKFHCLALIESTRQGAIMDQLILCQIEWEQVMVKIFSLKWRRVHLPLQFFQPSEILRIAFSSIHSNKRPFSSSYGSQNTFKLLNTVYINNEKKWSLRLAHLYTLQCLPRAGDTSQAVAFQQESYLLIGVFYRLDEIRLRLGNDSNCLLCLSFAFNNDCYGK